MKLQTVIKANNLIIKHYENGTFTLEQANKISSLFWKEYKSQVNTK